MNDGKQNELDEPYNDIYTQEYYLFLFSLLRKQQSVFQESKEGFTYVPMPTEEKITKQALIFLPFEEVM